MNKETKIVIVGGGIAGITTALCLEHFGFKNYEIYEQAAEFKEVGAAISLWPNALRVYQEIGMYDSLSLHWGEIKSAFIKTDKGKILTKTKPKYDLPLVCIHRARLLDTLLSKISQNKLFANHKLAEISEEANSTQLIFENGKTIKADIVIGADGINSKARKYVINDGSPIHRGYNIWRGIAELESISDGYGSESWGKEKRVGIVPIKDNQFGWWATLNEAEGELDGPAGSKAKLKELFSDWHSPIPDLIENSPEIIKNKIGDRKPQKGWHKKNVVLIGDAAHPTTPNLGQGACMSIEGAYLVAKCINKFNDFGSAFLHYEKLHFKRSSSVTKQSLLNGKIGQLKNSTIIRLRNFIFQFLPEKLALRMLDKYFGYDVTKAVVKSLNMRKT